MGYNIERLKKVFFEYNGEYSYDYYIDIINWNHEDAPALNIEQERVPGASRDVFFSDGTHANKIIDIECYLDVRHDTKRKKAHIKRAKQWLNQVDYKELRFSDDEGHYEAVCVSNLLFEEVVEGMYRTVISFSCYPYKITKTHRYELYKNSTITVKNEGYDKSPLRVKVYYTQGNVRHFNVSIRQDSEVINSFSCSTPSSDTDCVEINADAMEIKTTSRSGDTKDRTMLASSPNFPFVPSGECQISFDGFYNSFLSRATIEFDEREL